MNGSTSTLQLLDQLDEPSVDEAMAAALATSGPVTDRLARMLLVRRRPSGLSALVLHFHQLAPQVQEQIVRMAPDLYGPMRQVSQLSQTRGPRNVIEILRRSNSIQQAYLLTHLLVHGPAQTKRAAAACLRTLASWCCTDRLAGADLTADGRAVQHLQTVVEQLITCFDSHRCPEVLLAFAALAPRPLPKVLELLAKPRSSAADRMRTLLHRSEHRDVCRAIFVLVGHPTLATDALVALKRAVGGELLSSVLASAHLLRNGQVAKHIRQRQPLVDALPQPHRAVALAAHQARALPWLTNVDLAGARQIPYLRALSDHCEPMSRLVALRHLMPLSERNVPGASSAVSTFCFDDEPANACIALRHLISIGWQPLPKLMLQLADSPHEQLRLIVTAQLAVSGFERFWKALPDLAPQQFLAAGRALIKIDPNFHCTLGHRLMDPRRAVRLRALAIVGQLNQGDVFETTLLKLATSHDSVVAASAVRALGTTHTPRAATVMDRNLSHRDSRVRANTIEALQPQHITEHADRLAQMADREQNRPRANAIGALLRSRMDLALSQLDHMLGDRRVQHRTSALWLVEHAGIVQLASNVAEMSITDLDPLVRQRAGRVVSALIEMLQQPVLPLDSMALAA